MQTGPRHLSYSRISQGFESDRWRRTGVRREILRFGEPPENIVDVRDEGRSNCCLCYSSKFPRDVIRTPLRIRRPSQGEVHNSSVRSLAIECLERATRAYRLGLQARAPVDRPKLE